MNKHFRFSSIAFGLIAALWPASTASAETQVQTRLLNGVPVSATYVPVAASTTGLGGSRFVSSLALANPHSFPMVVTAYLLPAGEDNRNFRATARTIALPANGGTRIADPLNTLWGRTELLATLYLEAQTAPGNDGAFMVDAPVLNVANPSATFGISVAPTLSGVGPADRGHAAGIQNNTQYRTNIGVFNDSSSPTSVTVEILLDNGNVVGTKQYTLQPFSLIQDAVTSITGATFSNASVRLTPSPTLNGQIIGYAVVADNNTNDVVQGPSIQPYRPLSAGMISMPVELSRFRFSPGGPDGPPITLEAGKTYELRFHSIDVTHGISPIPQLGIDGSSSIAPGNDYVVNVTPSAQQRGSQFNFACTSFCGAGHGGMYGSIRIV